MRILLHAGTHKTGTSSFQQFMVDQADWLRAQGVEPYIETRPEAPGPNAALLAHDLLRAEVMTGSRLAGTMPPAGLGRMLQAIGHMRGVIAAARGRDLLISAEAFGFFRKAEERQWLAAACHGLPIVPLVVFREEAGWRRSWRAQIARNPGITPERMSAPGFPLLPDWWFDRGAIRRFWERTGPLVEVDYDAARARDGSVLPALCAALGLPRPPACDIWANRTPEMA